MRRRLAQIPARWILGATVIVVIAYSFPGYMNWDAAEQLQQARGLVPRLDWHPPVMAGYWTLIECIVHGPFGLLVLQTLLFTYGLYSVLRLRFPDKLAAWLTAAIYLFPPILTPMAPVWKDAQMAAVLITGIVLSTRSGWKARATGIAMLVLATALRDNGPGAVLPLCLLVVGSWGLRRWWRIGVAGIAMFVSITLVAGAINRALRQERVYPWFKSVAIEDIAGTLCFEDPMSDAEVTDVLEGTPLNVPPPGERPWSLQRYMCENYNPRFPFTLSFGDDHLFAVTPVKADRLARRRAWFRLVREHTAAYLAHRITVMREVLGLTDNPPWEPVCQTFAANVEQLRFVSHDHSLSWFQVKLGTWFRDRWSTTIAYRPWAYALLSLVLLGYAIRKRDAWLVALLVSGLSYEATLFLGAAAPDFRYSHWMVTCTCIALVCVFVERLREGLAARSEG